MLNALTGIFRARRDKKKLERLRWIIGAFTKLLGVHGVTLMVRIGSRVRSQLEHRFGPDYEVDINDDRDLEREERRIEFLSPEKLFELSRNFSLLADRTPEERDIAEAMSWRLISSWLEAKAIARESKSGKVTKEARDLEEICFFHVKSLIKVVRGERVMPDNAQAPLVQG